jgi:FtsP/CotA-like multicopper oxidase with cupredoxin domain
MNEHCFSDDNPVLDTDVRAVITYINSTSDPTDSVDWTTALDEECEDLAPSTLVPYNVSPPPAVDMTYRLDVSFQIGDFALDLAYINSTTWTPQTQTPTLNQAVAALHSNPTNTSFTTSGISSGYSASQLVVSVPKIATIDILLNNLDEGAHPFHLHGHQFWIMASSASGDFNWGSYPAIEKNASTGLAMRRDTLTVDAYGWALIRFRADNPGLWALHCHISWHMEAGLLMQWMTRTDLMETWTIPDDVLGLCKP